MSGTKRKLSFLAFTPQDNDDQVLLDEEMERVVWNEGLPGHSLPGPVPGSSHHSLGNAGEPCLDVAAPRPRQGNSASATDLSPLTQEPESDYAQHEGQESSSWGTLSAGTARAHDDERRVQFDRTHLAHEKDDSSGNDSDSSHTHGRYLE